MADAYAGFGRLYGEKIKETACWAQLDTFQPMLDLGKPFTAKGATFERPIMNYATLWPLKGSAASGEAAP